MKWNIKNFFLIVLYFILTMPVFLLGMYLITQYPDKDFSAPLGVAEGIWMIFVLLMISLFMDTKEENFKVLD